MISKVSEGGSMEMHEKKWFAVRTFSGHERKVKEYLDKKIESMGISDKMSPVYIPYEKFVEIKDGKKKNRVKNAFPGYVLVEAYLDNQTRSIVAEAPSVVGFLGAEKAGMPIPLRYEEVERLFDPQKDESVPNVRSPFDVGVSVKVVEGPFGSLVGVVQEIPAGGATPAPPVGPALGQKQVNIMEFCKQFNAKTQGQAGVITPVVITVYSDKSFTFITKTPPASILLLREAKIEKGSAVPNKTKVGKVSREQVRKIAEMKMPDLTAGSILAAERTIEGTALSMGIVVE
ncbi:hypothetical protein CHS0354_024095 [Potamilus streckersoni]|uniref:Large ribosomal subunit protein uL11 n=1 Tax=Potamilus streckersoni TaxID=2493646 RepID=A0AAE0VM08_9BIVA|nr:hypothetical protein CHS0354_024095 [Potamilus streckersoni]